MKRFLSTVLAMAMLATMFAGITAFADTAALVGNFIDLDFNDWESIESTDKNDNSFVWSFHNDTTPVVVTDADKGDKVLKFDSSSENGWVQIRHNLTDRDYFTRNESQWMEWSVKFEGGFAGVGYDHNNGFSPIFINENGVIKKLANRGRASNGDGSDIVSGGYQLELNKWYHIVVLMDTVNAPNGDGGRIYVWVNGEKVFNGTDYNSQFKVQAEGGNPYWSYYRFFVETPQAGTNVYIDNVKAYSTGSAVNDTHAADAWKFEPTDLDEDDGIYVHENQIVAKGKTVGDIKDAFSGVTFMADKADEESAADATLTAWAPNGYAYKEYTVLDQDVPVEILKKHALKPTTSIATANATYHPIERMFDNSFSGDDYFKANYTGTETPLVVTIPLDAYYDISSVTVYERYLTGQRNVTIELGKKNVFTTVVDNALLNASGLVCKTEFPIQTREADTIRLTFTGTSQGEKQGTYQIWELEAYGIKTQDKAKDILGPIGESAVASILTSIESSNATYHPISGMVNNGMSSSVDEDVYKSKNNVTDDLVVTINLDAYYTLENVIVYEKYLTGSALNVTVDLGKNSVYTNVATEVPLTVGTTHTTGTPTVISFADTEADTIRLTFKGTGPDGQEQKYQIYEIEAAGTKAGDFPVFDKISGPVGESSITSITTNIPTRAGVHPVSGMINGNREYSSSFDGTDDSLYKSNHDYDMNPLKVLLTFDGVYNIANLKLFERRLGQNPVTVSVFAGLNGEFEELVSDVTLTGGAYTGKALETSVNVPWADADAVLIVFENAGDYDGAESSYQISEIEVYGARSGDIEDTGVLSGYSYWEETTNSVVVAYSNATEEDIKASTLIAAYEGNKMVAVCKAREMTIPAGSVVAQYSMSVEGIKQEGRTYKAFVMDSLGGLKPLMKAEIIG